MTRHFLFSFNSVFVPIFIFLSCLNQSESANPHGRQFSQKTGQDEVDEDHPEKLPFPIPVQIPDRNPNPDPDQRYEIIVNRDKSQNTSYVFNHYFNSVIPSYFSNSVYCSDATNSVRLVMNRIWTNGSLDQVKETAIQDCLVSKGLPQNQCNGFVERYVPTFYHIVKRCHNLTVDTVVSTLFQSYGCGSNKVDEYMDWSVHIEGEYQSPQNINPPESEPNPEPGSQKKNKIKIKPSASKANLNDSIKILQLTDINLDLYYFEGTNAVCDGFGPCCELDSGIPANSLERAGIYGDGRKCDSPDHLVDKALQTISEKHPNIDVVILGGDYGAHDQWRATQEGNTDIIRYVSKLITYYFPTSIIIPILGDQEPHPAHQFSPAGEPEEISTRWIYNVTRDLWKSWIPQDQISTFLHGGYYFVQLGKGLKIIILNTNICFEKNLWQLYDVKDPMGQLQWLQNELYKSEEKNEHVYILGHVPPGSPGCTKVWSRNYHQIIERYRNTIKAQLFGHEGVDTFNMFYKPKSQVEPLHVQFVAPPFSPHLSNNPSYRIYYADESSWDLLDYETYLFDLKFANTRPRDDPKWFLYYKFTSAYNVTNLEPQTISYLVKRLTLDDQLFHNYFQRREKDLRRTSTKSCDAYCRKKILCQMVTPFSGEDSECEAIQRQHDGIVVPIYNLG